jgi:dihydroxy-acid dehydratase
MACVTETLGMSVTKCATTLALDPLKKKQAYETGKRIVELVKKNLTPSQIMTKGAFENAIRVDMTMGGSTNAVLHIPAVARELGIDITVDTFENLAKETPNICHLIPAGKHEMADLDKAGGIPGVLSRIKSMLHDNPTVNEKSLLEIAQEGKVYDDEVIRPLDNPYFKQGGIAVLKGNLCHSGVVKQTAVGDDMMVHMGPAKVFTTEDGLLDAIQKKSIKEGDVVILNFLGPAGAPGMPEMLTPTDAIKGAGYKKVALVTDGRFSGGTSGPCIGHVEPEAYNGGAIGALKDGDIVEINIPKRSLNVKLTDVEIKTRLNQINAPQRKMTPILESYRVKFTGKNCYGK